MIELGKSLKELEQEYRERQAKKITAEKFLRDVIAVDRLEGFEKLYLRKNGQYSIDPEELDGLQQRLNQNRGSKVPPDIDDSYYDVYYSPLSFGWLDKKIKRRNEYVRSFAAIVFDYDGVARDKIEEGLNDLGITPHYIIRTRPLDNHFQVVIKLEPQRVSTKNLEWLKKEYETLQKLIGQKTGADPNAAQLNQMFRLPGSWRDIPGKGRYQVSVVDRNYHDRYSHDSLLRSVIESLSPKVVKQIPKKKTYRGYNVTKDNTGDTLDAPVIKKILNGVVVEESRNTAVTALSYTFHMAGYEYEEAKDKLLDWTHNHTEPVYPEKEALTTLKSAYKNPKGLDHEKLATIDLDYENITEKMAKSIYSYMPGIRQKHELKENIKYDTRVKSIVDVLEALSGLGENYPQLTTSKLSKLSGVSKSTIAQIVKPFLERMDIYIKGHRPSMYALESDFLDPDRVLFGFLDNLDLQYNKPQVLWYLHMRNPNLLKKLLDVVNALAGSIEEFLNSISDALAEYNIDINPYSKKTEETSRAPPPI